jgi:hypothetical protein
MKNEGKLNEYRRETERVRELELREFGGGNGASSAH